ncbi:MAG: hypothetical protein COB53_13030 [Elusimicrobia bacterium]|nr:MAG: hypothetical protein COB53_13030 [Elusimicrobiota bacterium]
MNADVWRKCLEVQVGASRRETERLLVVLGEIEDRALAVKDGYPSLYSYLTGTLGFSEVEAVIHLKAARAGRHYPALRRLLRRGTLSLSTLAAIGPHLCRDNWKTLTKMTAGMPIADVRRILASLDPKAEPRQAVRYAGPECGPARDAGPSTPPLPRRVEIAFGADEEFLDQLERARALLRSKYPSGKFEDLFAEAIEALVQKAEKRSLGRPRAPRWNRIGVERPQGARYVPQKVRAEVWKRDGGRCVYEGRDGLRCTETTRLEFDHLVPWALGGTSHDSRNIRLMCRVHNQARIPGELLPNRRAQESLGPIADPGGP